MEVRVAKLGEAVQTVTIEGEVSSAQEVVRTAGYELKETDALMVNGEEATPTTEVHQGDIVTLVPKVKGGQR